MGKQKSLIKERKRKHRPLLIATMMIGIVLPIYFVLQWFAFHGGELAISLGCILVGICMLFIYKSKVSEKVNSKNRGLRLSVFGIVIEVISITFLLLEFNGISLPYSPYSVVLIYFSLIAPFMGMIIGFQGLFSRGISGRTRFLFFIAAILPFAVVGGIILLASQGVWVIRFM